MADKKQTQGVESGVMSADEGWSYLASMSQQYLDKVLQCYGIQVAGWKITEREKGTTLTVKLQFPAHTTSANANYWSWLVGSALFPGIGKPFVQTGMLDGSIVGYVSMTFWNEVTHRESKQNSNLF